MTAYDKGDIPSYRQCASPGSELLLTHASTGGPPAPAVVLAQFLAEPRSFPLGLCAHRALFVPFQSGVSVFPSPVEVL